ISAAIWRGRMRSSARVLGFTPSVARRAKRIREAIAPACYYYRSVPPVESGLEVLVHRWRSVLRGQRVALVAHQASTDSRYQHAIALLRELRGVRLRTLLA